MIVNSLVDGKISHNFNFFVSLGNFLFSGFLITGISSTFGVGIKSTVSLIDRSPSMYFLDFLGPDNLILFGLALLASISKLIDG